MAQLTVQRISGAGLAPVFENADAAGDVFKNNGRTFLVIKNGSASQVTVTINSQRPCNYGFDHDLTVQVPASAERWIGPFQENRFNDQNGNVAVSYSAAASVTVAAVELS